MCCAPFLWTVDGELRILAHQAPRWLRPLIQMNVGKQNGVEIFHAEADGLQRVPEKYPRSSLDRDPPRRGGPPDSRSPAAIVCGLPIPQVVDGADCIHEEPLV